MESLQNGSGDATIQAKMDGLALEEKNWSLGKKQTKKPPKIVINRQPTNIRQKNEGDQKARAYKNSQVKPANKNVDKKRCPSRNSRTVSQTSEISQFSVGDLEEAFSETEDERENEKPSLPMPHPRARTLSGQWLETGYSPKWGGASMCVSCLEFFNLPDQIAAFKEHLLNEHKIVISELEAIVDLKRYVGYWRCRFNKQSVDKIFPRIEVSKEDPLYGQVSYYYCIAPSVEEDANLRRNLALRRLEEVLACQQREREDNDFNLQCIFCRYVARDNRSKMLRHLVMCHHLNLGRPDNLVFVREYIEELRKIVDRNECIKCEQGFSNKMELLEHMRKKNHKEVNPKNHYYDKFYIINYLEVGKRWLDVLALDYEDTSMAFQDSEDEEEEIAWNEWEKDNILDDTRAVCIVCDATNESLEGLMEHVQNSHGFDFIGKIKELGLDTYQRMKLLNYIRKQNSNGNCWICPKEETPNSSQHAHNLGDDDSNSIELPKAELWDKEEYLVPMFGNDNLLWLLESHLTSDDESSIVEKSTPEKENKKISKLIEKSKKCFIEGVIAEDLPDLHEITNSQLDFLM